MEELRKISVIYEDNHLLVVEKPINIPVCEDESHDMDFLTILKKYIKNKYDKPGNVYLGLVHRLDRPVGGIMVFAKTSKAASRLSKQVQDHSFKKTYVAVCEGKVPDSGEWIDYLVKDSKTNTSYVTDKDHGKIAKLKFKRLAFNNGFSLIEVYLETGRSHQIRVQFSSRGFPLVGDARYNPNSDKKTSIALFAKNISFEHPITKEKLFFELEIPKRYPYNLF